MAVRKGAALLDGIPGALDLARLELTAQALHAPGPGGYTIFAPLAVSACCLQLLLKMWLTQEGCLKGESKTSAR